MAKPKKAPIKDHKNKITMAIGAGLILAGLFFGGLDFLRNWMNGQGTYIDAQAIHNTEPVVTPEPLISGKPTHIKIASLNIDLEVAPGEYNPKDKSWTLSLTKAHWGTMTYPSNNKEGLTFIYAHNRKGVFNSLPKVQPGDEVIINTDSNRTFTYKFVSSTVTKPEDTSILSYTGKPILVLQTCTGTWYQDRQLFVFDFVNVQ